METPLQPRRLMPGTPMGPEQLPLRQVQIFSRVDPRKPMNDEEEPAAVAVEEDQRGQEPDPVLSPEAELPAVARERAAQEAADADDDD